MRNVKRVDLALVVGDVIGTQLAASLVTVLRFLGREYWDGYGAQPTWLVEAAVGSPFSDGGSNSRGKMPDC